MKFVSKNAEQRTICFQIKKNSNFELSNRDTELLKKKKERHRYQYGFIGLPQWRRQGFDPWVRKIPWSTNGNSLQYSEKSHGQRSLVG